MTLANDFFNRLEGVWENRRNKKWEDNFGWNFITQPKLNAPGTRDFQMQFHQMRETIRFRKLGIARNIGETGEAGFWQGMSYEIEIKTPEDKEIHQEMGHFLLHVKDDIEGETELPLKASIIRQATIPRANAMLTHGEIRIESISDATANQGGVAFYNVRPQIADATLQAKIDTELNAIQQTVSQLDGPDLQKPLKWLQGILKKTVIGQDWVFSFRNDSHPSQMASGQRVKDPVKIGNLLSDFWIGDRSIDGKEIRILQYIQKVDLEFNGEKWPHVALNTLIKQP